MKRAATDGPMRTTPLCIYHMHSVQRMDNFKSDT